MAIVEEASTQAEKGAQSARRFLGEFELPPQCLTVIRIAIDEEQNGCRARDDDRHGRKPAWPQRLFHQRGMAIEAAHVGGKGGDEDTENGSFENRDGLEEGENQRQRRGDQRDPPGAVQPLSEAARGDDEHAGRECW